ncbi:polysulfide reductase NrfD [Streptomyces glaucosporus]|uniref:Polysulfide reductase NrfD n=1 Tax=Streptomyces glaucosporus TaxID=284044 RepID=A0ABP5W579_9ACTN
MTGTPGDRDRRQEPLPREPLSDSGARDRLARMFTGERDDGRRGNGGHREQPAVPEARFRSYYGRAVLKTPVWDWKIPAYFFTGGLSAGSALLAAGADLTARPALRRACRIGALATVGASTYLLVADLGRPERFHHMLRVAKPTSPMSVGTWILSAYGSAAALAAAGDLMPRRLRRTPAGRLAAAAGRPATLASAALAPPLASYTAVLLSQTAVPAWHEAHPYLPFVFTGSAAAAAGGLGMALAPVHQAAPARRFAVCGAALELLSSRRMEARLGLAGEAYGTGRAHRLRKASEYLTAAGLAGTVLLAARGRAAAAACGLALMAGGLLQRLGVFEAGVASARDPKYVTVPQRQRLEEGQPVRHDGR